MMKMPATAAANRTTVWKAMVPRSLRDTLAKAGLMEPNTAIIIRP